MPLILVTGEPVPVHTLSFLQLFPLTCHNQQKPHFQVVTSFPLGCENESACGGECGM